MENNRAILLTDRRYEMTNVNGYKEFTNKKTGSFGFIINTFKTADGTEWANVHCFAKSSYRKTTMKVSDLIIE